MTKTCKRCGAEFATGRPQAIYCSMACYRPPLTKECRHCGKTFRWKPSLGDKPFCSNACYWGSSRKAARRAKAKACPTCGKDLTGEAKDFCGWDCYMNRGSIVAPRPCGICGKEFRPQSNQVPGKYCSNACKAKSHIEAKVPVRCGHCHAERMVLPWRAARPAFYCTARCQRLAVALTVNQRKWINGAAPTAYHHTKDWKKKAAKIRKRDGYRCQDCGISQKEFGATLHVHHKKPIRLGGTDRPSNLVTLCKRCHTTAENQLWAVEFQVHGGIRKQLTLPLH